MTMTQSERFKHGQQEKRFRNFHEKLDLNVTAPEQEQQPVQWELLENHCSRYTELPQRMEKNKDNHSAEVQQHGDKVHQTKTLEGCVDHLLILAQSAEIVSHSEDGVAEMHTSDQNKGSQNNMVDLLSQECACNIIADDQECSLEPLDRLSLISHVSSQSCGIYSEVTRPRLAQIRKQARGKYIVLDQEKAKDDQGKHSQGNTIRLSQVKHEARCKSKNDLLPQEMITRPLIEQPQGRILRLSQMKHQARSKGNSTVKEGTEESMDGSLHYNRFKDFNLYVPEGVPAQDFFREASQSSVARWDDQNLREHQRTARQLRAFKTKKLRQRLRTQCLRSSANTRLQAMEMSPIGLTSMNNSQWLSHSVTLLMDKESIASQQELPKTSRCNEKLRTNFCAEKVLGHHGCNDSSETSMIPNVLPVQNKVLSFTRLPNNIFQHSDTTMGWMMYMQHKEYHRVVARHRRAERMEEKRASKDKQQNSKNPLHAANSEAQKEFMPMKRLRLTQLRREVRFGNHCSVLQEPAEN